MATIEEIVTAFAHYCGIEEGYFRHTRNGLTIPQKMFNPLDLRVWKAPNGKPYPTVNGYVSFPRCQINHCQNSDHPAEVGWRAGRAQCKINIITRGLTFREFFAGKPGVYGGFAPEKDKNIPIKYAQAVLDGVRNGLGLDPAITIDSAIYLLAEDGLAVRAAKLEVSVINRDHSVAERPQI